MSWELTNLQEVTSKIGDGLHGTPKYDKNGEYYFINGNNLRQGRIEIKDDTKKIDFQEYQKIKKELNNQTVFVAINGTLGNVGLYNGEKIALGKSACYLNVNENVEKLFIRYVLENDTFQSYAQRFATGATIKNLGLKAVRNYEFFLPPLQTQKCIADILSTYDNLIENNLKRIKLLEQAAQNIYKEWFVNLRFPSHENTPINEETGLPEGWVLKAISESQISMIDGDRGKNYPKSFDFYSSGYCLFLNTGNVRKSGLDFSNTKFITKEKDDKLRKGKTQDKDIILTTRGTIGNVAYITKNIPYKHVRINSGMLIIRVNELEIKSEYLFELLNSDEYNSKLISISSGAAQPQLPISILKHLEIVIPDIQLQRRFTSIQLSLNSFASNLKNQNQKLKAARDILLPRLMNRTIDV